MTYINLLPVRQIRKRLQIRNEIAIYLASIILLVVIIFVVGLSKLSIAEQLRSENKTLTEKKASYQPILNEIEKLKKDKAEQETKLDVIKKLKTNSQITVHVMDELANRTPANRVWLTSLRQAGMELNIAGIALDNATIAQFMESIADSDYFTSADLSSSSQTVIAGAKLKSFSLKIGLTTPHE